MICVSYYYLQTLIDNFKIAFSYTLKIEIQSTSKKIFFVTYGHTEFLNFFKLI